MHASHLSIFFYDQGQLVYVRLGSGRTVGVRHDVDTLLVNWSIIAVCQDPVAFHHDRSKSIPYQTWHSIL